MKRRPFLLIWAAFLSLMACQSPEPPPATFLLAEADLPEYEQRLDHARLVAGWSEEFYHKGMVIYLTESTVLDPKSHVETRWVALKCTACSQTMSRTSWSISSRSAKGPI